MFKKIVRDLVSHCGPPYDRYDRDIDIIYILYHYFLYPFSGETPDVLALNTSFFILYLCVGLIILVYYWKISNKKLADQLLEQQVRMQQDYIKDLEKNYQDLREFKHDYQNLLFLFTAIFQKAT